MKRSILLFFLLSCLGYSQAGFYGLLSTSDAGPGTISFTTKSQEAGTTADPVTHTHTPTGQAASVLMVSVLWHQTSARTGGSPTADLSAITESGTVVAESETSQEMWYVIGDFPDGVGVDISVPNTAALSIQLEVVSVLVSSGTIAIDDDNVGSNSGSANPSVSVTTTADGAFIYARLGSGNVDVTTGTPAHTLTFETDVSNWGFSGQYLEQVTAGAQAMNWTLGLDDWTMKVISFKPE